MTEGVSLKPDMGRYGVWPPADRQPEQAAEIEGWATARSGSAGPRRPI